MKAAAQKNAPPRYVIKITLAKIKPAIWRRVVVRADIPLEDLHFVIQKAFGWWNYHLHEFTINGTSYELPEPGTGALGEGRLDERFMTLADFPALKRFHYEYDFGDGWGHELVIEQELPPDPKFRHPVCVTGRRARPPEDCGGVTGYDHMRCVLASPRHPERKGFLDWLGGEWNEDYFDITLANVAMENLRGPFGMVGDFCYD